MVFIGSKATKYWFPDFPREPVDVDFFCLESEIPQTKSKGIEYLFIPPLVNYINKEDVYINKDVLYTLKISHLFWNFKWEKHIFDVVFLKNKGCKLIKPLFYELYEFWNCFHGKNIRSNLELSTKDFFNNALEKYDHDYLHTLINPSPIYKKILKGGKEVEVDENKFDSLSFEDKLELVREEVYVMAFERLNERNYKIAYSWMLKKFIMNHAPLFEAIFIIENYKILHKPIINYKNIIENELLRRIKK